MMDISTAPRDGTEIIGIYDEGEFQIFWSDRPVCMGGPTVMLKPGWATCGQGVDYNLPMDWNECWYMSPGPDRGKKRARTDPAVARAIADQWGPYFKGEKNV
jgi:hypothetical protein